MTCLVENRRKPSLVENSEPPYTCLVTEGALVGTSSAEEPFPGKELGARPRYRYMI